MYNPSGKYMVALNLNGCQRKVVVDDFFPVDKHSSFLCSLTTNRGELWVSLLEKAYLKGWREIKFQTRSKQPS